MTILSDVALLYRRAGFGATPAELEAAASGGYPAAVDLLLAGLGPAPDPGGDSLPPPTFVGYPAGRSRSKGSPAAEAATKDLERTWRTELVTLQDWWLDRMIQTSTPLREKLTLLWHGHFATGISKVRDPQLMYVQNQLFRSNGSGNFGDLVQAVAKGGAMMIWLDTASDEAAHPNENFARECMELFTLGLGYYSQADVEEVARCFTGWAYDRVAGRWVLRARQHDDGIKTFLGHTGDFSGEEALDIIVSQPESARFVVSKVWSHLAYPVKPSDPVVTDLVGSYGPGYDLAALLRAVFLHPAFLSPAARTGLVKQPIEYLVGAARALGLDASGQRTAPTTGSTAASPSTVRAVGPGGHRRLATMATLLGQTPFDPTNVGGWGQNDYWLDTATSLARLTLAGELAARADLSALESAAPSQRIAAVAGMLGLVDGFSPPTSRALAAVSGNPHALLTLALNSPDYVLD
jgi:uncharacterized protein (DUF1800 family)